MRLTCEVLRLKLREAHLVTIGNKADIVERLLQHEASYVQGPSGLPECREVPNRPPPTPRTTPTMRMPIRTRSPVATRLLHRAHHAALDDSDRDPNDQQSLVEPSAAPQRAQRGKAECIASPSSKKRTPPIPLQRSLSKPLPKGLAITPVGANPPPGKDATDDPRHLQAVPAAPTAPAAPAARRPSPATLTHAERSGNQSPSGTRGTITPGRATTASQTPPSPPWSLPLLSAKL